MPGAGIMIVEDEVVVAMEIQRKLESMGYHVTGIASSGEDAVDLAGRTKPDLILMDIRLAGGLDGIEAAQQIRERYDIPVVYLTAYADEKTIERAKHTEPFGYLLKPFTEAELRSTIEISLYKHGQEAKARKLAQGFSTTLSVLGGATIVVDRNSAIEHMNSVAQTLTGWNKESAAGKHLADVCVFMEPDTRRLIQDPISLPLNPGFVSPPERYLLICGNKTEIYIESRTVPVTDARGEVTGAVLAFQDVTQDIWANEDWFSYAANLCLSADLARAREDYSEAESLYQRALLTLVKNLGTDHPKVAYVLKELAVVFEQMGKPDPARALQSMVLQIEGNQ